MLTPEQIQEIRKENGRKTCHKMHEFLREKWKKVKEKYLENPSICKYCKSPIPFEKKRDKYCSHECHNKDRGHEKTNCIFCGKENNTGKKYCSLKCQFDHTWDKRKRRFETTGKFSDATNNSSIMRDFKKYIIETRGHKCEICGNTEWMGKSIPLVLDHINGNGEENTLENLRVVCGNCDMQLPTYKSKNRGKGRLWRKFIYHAEKNKVELVKSGDIKIDSSLTELKPIKTQIDFSNQDEFSKKVEEEKQKQIIKQRKFHVSKEELEKMVKEMPFSEIAKIFNVTSKSIKKRCKMLGIEEKPYEKGFWAKVKAGKIKHPKETLSSPD